jgi:hypothetical protein
MVFLGCCSGIRIYCHTFFGRKNMTLNYDNWMDLNSSD